LGQISKFLTLLIGTGERLQEPVERPVVPMLHRGGQGFLDPMIAGV
jgi:hypothetical protein